ncbi:hypothetical protein HYH03_008420 [Edaphochlamys debaryana]|uniref:Nucleotide exchange factor Fes1 domain-containing protein n=1 Tax=Edaphochlamys debaryana TaxID=47281 RepID=A0A836BZE2_9CHLO|nr:hypothetical protein HYH03_008420 [Edaphochlamys debaryana]|eukprot:KAG2493284.1 hypothetical protein HYH03_008420 [Edaphochlamys debaryana]
MRAPSRLLVFAGLLGCCAILAAADFGANIVGDVGIEPHGEFDENDPQSMESLLHWAISNSNPEKLSAQAEEAAPLQMVKDLKEQRRRVKELLDHVSAQPTEVDMMKEGIDILRRDGASDTELLAALQALQVLVEPIDNANDLRPLGGISPVVAVLTRGPELAAAAAHVLGTACSNNPTFQRALMAAHPDIVGTLLRVSESAEEGTAVKGMYALAALVRNLPEMRRAFVDAGGFRSLELLLRGEGSGARVKRRALSLFMDLVDTQPAATAETHGGAEGEGLAPGEVQAGDAASHVRRIQLGADGSEGQDGAVSGAAADGAGADPTAAWSANSLASAAIGSGLPEAVASLLLQPDPDMQEKALLVVQRLATDAVARRVLRANGADEAVASLQAQLRADAPGPGDEADPYHEYLTALAARVAELLAVADPPSAAEASGSGAGQAAGAAEGQGGAGAGKEGGSSRRWRARQQEAEGAEAPADMLALGGPGLGSGSGAAAVGGGEQCGSEGDSQKGQCAAPA